MLTMVSALPVIFSSRELLIFAFFLQGLLSGILISRWMVWFSSEETILHRGRIFGINVGLAFVTLTAIIILSSISGDYLGHIISSMAVLSGGFFCTRLPVPEANIEPLNIVKALPPFDLLIFAAIGYSSVSLLYRVSFTPEIQHQFLPWLQLIPYLLLSFIVAKFTDKAGLNLFQLGAFVFSGFGFIIYSVSAYHQLAFIVVGVLIPAAMLCIHFYYWLSLVERQSKQNAPFYLALGVSFELLIFSIFYSIAGLIHLSSRMAHIIIGTFGTVLALLGIALSAYTFYRMYLRQQKDSKIIRAFDEDDLASVRHINNRKIKALLTYYHEKPGEVENLLARQFNLTSREVEVAYYLFLDYSNDEIKHRLIISMNTLKYHIRNVYSKIGASKREKAAEIVYDVIAEKMAEAY